MRARLTKAQHAAHTKALASASGHRPIPGETHGRISSHGHHLGSRYPQQFATKPTEAAKTELHEPISHATAEGQISRTSCTKPHAGGARLQMVKSPHSKLHIGGPCPSFSHQERPSKRASQRKPNAALRKAADGLVTTPELRTRIEQRAMHCKAAPSSRWSDHHMNTARKQIKPSRD